MRRIENKTDGPSDKEKQTHGIFFSLSLSLSFSVSQDAREKKGNQF